MDQTANDLKAFYNSKMGRVVRRLLNRRIKDIWPNIRDEKIVGLGYTVPYLPDFLHDSTQVMGIAPAEQGGYHWPKNEKNKICLANDSEIPLAAESVDKVLLMHHLEFTYDEKNTLSEIWRILKPRGRLLLIVPNRNSFWARAEWSAFGHGRPYTLSQLCRTLHESQFATERLEEGLFMPPIRKNFIMKSAGFFEGIGQTILPIAAGVHIVEVSKQIYAPVDRGGTLSRIRKDGFKIPKPALSNRT